jgi:hypothetical protein
MRHLISGIDCAIAGAAMVAAPATPIPVTLIKSRRFIEFPSFGDVMLVGRLLVEALGTPWNIHSGISSRTGVQQRKKPGLWRGRAFHDRERGN